MTTPKYHPEDWGSMLQAVRDWVAAEVPSLSTDPAWLAVFGSEVPAASQPPKPFATINVLAPPIQDGYGDSSPFLFKGCAVQVENVIDGTLYTIVYNDTDADFTSGVDATLQEIVDGLIASVNAVAGSTVATQVLNAVHISGSPTIDVDSDPNLTLKKISATEAEATATFSINFFGRGNADRQTTFPGPLFESVAAMGKVRQSLDSEAVKEQLLTAGWAFISVEGERKPDEVVSGNREDRAGFDVRLRCRTRVLRVQDFIEDAPIGTSIVGTLSN